MKQLILLFLMVATLSFSQDKTVVQSFGHWNIQTHTSGEDLVSVAAWTAASNGEAVMIVVSHQELKVYIDWNRKLFSGNGVSIVTELDSFVDVSPWYVYQGKYTFPPDEEAFFKLLKSGTSLTVTAESTSKTHYSATFMISGLTEALDHSPDFKAYFGGGATGK